MKTEEFKALTPFQQAVLMLLEKICTHVVATYNIIQMDDEERSK